MKQPCCRINHQRCADNHQNVSLLYLFGSNSDVRNGLAKEYDERTEQRTVASLSAGLNLAVLGGKLNLIACLLLHGSSAAFWEWDWWRRLPGERWVRPNDPDGVEASTHPRKPYTVRISKTRHELASKLSAMELPEDEIYTNLENTCPCMRLMETHIEEGTFVQCCEAVSPWGGKVLSFIPGHDPAVTSNPVLIRNIATIMDYLQEEQAK